MKTELKIQNAVGMCKNCFRLRRDGSAYCGQCKDEPERMKIYMDEQKNFPLFKKAKKKFPISETTIFTYGDTIYFDRELPYDLVAHEITHVFQQEKEGVENWWDKYFKSKNFRLKQEAEAYHNQYEAVRRNDLVKAAFTLTRNAEELSGKLYGEIISFEDAKKMIINL